MPAERTYSGVLNNGIPVTLRFRAVKLFRISVKPDGSVEAVAPRRMSIAHAMRLANERADWAAVHRERFLARPKREFTDGETASLWAGSSPCGCCPARRTPRSAAAR